MQPNFIEKRACVRYSLSGRLPGELIDASGIKLTCFPVDISDTGLGIILAKKVQAGDLITLHPSNKTIETISFEIMWIKPQANDPSMFRVGLKCLSEEIKLVKHLGSDGSLLTEDLS